MFVNEEGCVEKFAKFEHTLDARFKPQTAVGQANGCLWLSWKKLRSNQKVTDWTMKWSYSFKNPSWLSTTIILRYNSWKDWISDTSVWAYARNGSLQPSFSNATIQFETREPRQVGRQWANRHATSMFFETGCLVSHYKSSTGEHSNEPSPFAHNQDQENIEHLFQFSKTRCISQPSR